jgi:transcriptional regulator with GAF, ATPase, and Fis domain
MAERDDKDRIISLVLALHEKPVSVDSLIEWAIARPSELFAWLDAARERKVVTEDASSGPGHLRLTDEARERGLVSATADDFRVLARQPVLVPELLGAARRQAARRSGGIAAELYRAVFETVPPEAFPGGPAGYVDALVEGLRLFRGVCLFLGDVMDTAIALATERGDLSSQALLLAARALSAANSPLPGDSEALLARAHEAAEAVGGTVRIEVLVYTAVSLVYAGRLRDGIAVFETLLGDVPLDLATTENRPAIDPAALCVLAAAYSRTGQQPRAIELLHRLLDLGERMGAPPVSSMAKLFLGLLHAMHGEREAALEFVETAYDQFISGGTEPVLGWFAGIALASVRAAQGRLAEARTALDAGAIAWKRGGSRPLPELATYEVVEQLEAAGQALPTEIDMLAEAERAVAIGLPQPAGLGHRFLALRMVRTAKTEAELATAAARLETAIALLRAAGTTHDLGRVCTEAAALADRRGHPDEAHRLRAEAEKAAPAQRGSAVHTAARLRSAVLDLGRLPLRGHGEGLWGQIAARLCEAFGVERCALVELGQRPRLLAARGGTRTWQEEILARAASLPAAPQVTKTPRREGQIVIVPFSAPDLERRGFIVLENDYAAPTVSMDDGELLDALGGQLGVLFGNLILWQELTRARERLEQENRYFRESVPAATVESQVVAHSPAMQEVMGLVARVAPATTTVLITGETGVGKELVAHEIHRQSPRRNGPFIAVHIASLAPGLVASGLFGHERGAFTGATEQTKGRFELADGGTLLLDEVGELSLEDQVRLLRVLQEGTFERVGGTRPLRSNFRLVAATNRDLNAEVRASRFREDLYFRLCTFPIRVPPLRERREEIPTLALFFMERVARQRGVRFEGIGEADMKRLVDWDWPGNVRELSHVIERASLLSEPPRLHIPPLDGGLTRAPEPSQAEIHTEETWVSLAEAERRYIRRVLQYARGRVTGAGGAAEILGLKPSTLNFRLKKLGLREDLARSRRAPRTSR